MRQSQNYNFRLITCSNPGDGLTIFPIIDTDGHEEVSCLINFDLTDGTTATVTGLVVQSSNASDFGGVVETLYNCGVTKNTDGSTSSLPVDKDMRVISIKVGKSKPNRRYVRLTCVVSLNSEPATDVSCLAVLAMRHEGDIPMTNTNCAGTNGEAVIKAAPAVGFGT